jgi:hypothetical protein
MKRIKQVTPAEAAAVWNSIPNQAPGGWRGHWRSRDGRCITRQSRGGARGAGDWWYMVVIRSTLRKRRWSPLQGRSPVIRQSVRRLLLGKLREGSSLET